MCSGRILIRLHEYAGCYESLLSEGTFSDVATYFYFLSSQHALWLHISILVPRKLQQAHTAYKGVQNSQLQLRRGFRKIFLFLQENIFWVLLEVPCWGTSNECQQHIFFVVFFFWRIKKNIIFFLLLLLLNLCWKKKKMPYMELWKLRCHWISKATPVKQSHYQYWIDFMT